MVVQKSLWPWWGYHIENNTDCAFKEFLGRSADTASSGTYGHYFTLRVNIKDSDDMLQTLEEPLKKGDDDIERLSADD